MNETDEKIDPVSALVAQIPTITVQVGYITQSGSLKHKAVTLRDIPSLRSEDPTRPVFSPMRGRFTASPVHGRDLI